MKTENISRSNSSPELSISKKTSLSEEDLKSTKLAHEYISSMESSTEKSKIREGLEFIAYTAASSIFFMGMGVVNIVDNVADIVLSKPVEERSRKPNLLQNCLYFIPGVNIAAFFHYQGHRC
ncbi:MAG: hypothetical protein CMO81_07870 [Waddliaceae bacterium]|nr:hypothetical protein [Waddliaceae bacterium]